MFIVDGQDGCDHFALGQITEIDLRNIWSEDPTMRGLIRQKGRVDPITERQDTHTANMLVSSVFGKNRTSYQPSMLGTVPSATAILIPPLAHAITLEPSSWSSPIKAEKQRPSISKDPKLVPDANGVMMYDYGGKIGNVYNPKVVAAEGLRCYHNFQYAGIAEAKDYFLNSADWLVENASAKEGGKYSLWEYNFPWMFYGGIAPPYASALAQAEGAELLTKAYALTNEEKYLQVAQKAVASFLVDYEDGGVASLEDDGDSIFLQVIAKPGFKKTYVLNGHTGALLHLWEYYKITKDEVSKDVFDRGMNYLKNNLAQFDCGDWSYYDKMGTKAMDSYHKGHIKQLLYLFEITSEPVLEEYGYKFLVYYKERQGRIGERPC